MTKYKSVTYCLWLVGGWLGLHHFYLGRDRQAFLWWATAGGGFGMGWVRDLWRIPEYVDDANNDPQYVSELRYKMNSSPKPPFCSTRFLAQLAVGMLFGFLLHAAIPQELFAEDSPYKILLMITPYAVAVGRYKLD